MDFNIRIEENFMNYDFTSYVNRDNTGAVKWELMHQLNPNVDEGVLPLSVADMEIGRAHV